ncbi:MAG: type II toxin-antitoxin system HicB family antitoxin [Nanoarchaeota archaeon]|nr:type II toxin-antitoxin system HicB family antitoxin [Nanoarchaeota archaeon]
MAKTYTVLIEQDEEGWYVSEVLELPGCHTQAKTLDQLLTRTKEAIKGYQQNKTKKTKETFIGVQHITV